MSPQNEPALLFDLRCRTRREVAEVLLRLSPESEAGRLLRQRYLAALHSGARLQEVRVTARELTRPLSSGI